MLFGNNLLGFTSMDLLHDLVEIEMCHGIFPVEDLCNFLKRWAVRLHIDEVHKNKFKGVPELVVISASAFSYPNEIRGLHKGGVAYSIEQHEVPVIW